MWQRDTIAWVAYPKDILFFLKYSTCQRCQVQIYSFTGREDWNWRDWQVVLFFPSLFRYLFIPRSPVFPPLWTEKLTKLKQSSHVDEHEGALCVCVCECVCVWLFRVFVPGGTQGRVGEEECVLSCEVGVCQDKNNTTGHMITPYLCQKKNLTACHALSKCRQKSPPSGAAMTGLQLSYE